MRILALAAAAALALAFIPSADAQPAVAPCTGPNEHVWRDLSDTRADPTHPQCGSLTDPCWMDGGRCGGCGPPILEWIVGPIYCF
jgi:hypothetical protein